MRSCLSSSAFQRLCPPSLLGVSLTIPPTSAQGFQAVCESIRDCVRCQTWGTGNLKGNCSSCHLQVQMVEELKKGNGRGRAGHSHMWCLLCALLCVSVHVGLLPKSFLALVTSQPCPLSPQRRLASTAPSRMRMMTAPTTTPWRETPVSSPTPLSVCRRIKVSRALGGAGDVHLDQSDQLHGAPSPCLVPLLCPWAGSAAGSSSLPTLLCDTSG